jgi:hypothetical protein
MHPHGRPGAVAAGARDPGSPAPSAAFFPERGP